MTPLEIALNDLACELRAVFEQKLRATEFGPESWTLTQPRICVMEPKRSRSVLGWYAPMRWSQGAVSLNEIVLTPMAVSHGILAAVEVLAHEFVHLANAVAKRQDTSRQGRYHNDLFRQTATAIGLVVTQDPQQGWCLTTLGPELKQWTQEMIRRKGVSPHVFKYQRRLPPRSKPSLVKLVADCGTFAYVPLGQADEIRIRCDRCGSLLCREDYQPRRRRNF